MTKLMMTLFLILPSFTVLSSEFEYCAVTCYAEDSNKDFFRGRDIQVIMGQPLCTEQKAIAIAMKKCELRSTDPESCVLSTERPCIVR